MIITSPANERIKHARSVRDGRESDLIFIEGERLVEECLRSNLKLIASFHDPVLSLRAQGLIEELERRNCPIYPTASAVLATLSDTVNTQGVIVVAEKPSFTLTQALSARAGEAPLVVGLDELQDPGNFGTIMRTAEAAGASGVIALKGSVDAFAPKTLRSSMGSAFRLPVVTQVETEELFAEASAAGIKIIASAAKGETVYYDWDWRQPALLVFGNEARGLSGELMERCDARLRIPLRATVESLNVAAAAAVILFEAARQRFER